MVDKLLMASPDHFQRFDLVSVFVGNKFIRSSNAFQLESFSASVGRASCDTVSGAAAPGKVPVPQQLRLHISLTETLTPRTTCGYSHFSRPKVCPEFVTPQTSRRATHAELFGRSTSIPDIFLYLVTGSLEACQRVLIGSSAEDSDPRRCCILSQWPWMRC